MKREIRFRGKDLENENSWRYGSLIVYPNGNCVIVEFDKDGNELSYDVDSETVGQFTGLYDKDGKEIYEGDIILEKLKGKRKDGYPYEIVFEDFQWFGKNKYGGRTSLSLLNDFHEIKVIGNVHDNPELLKGNSQEKRLTD